MDPTTPHRTRYQAIHNHLNSHTLPPGYTIHPAPHPDQWTWIYHHNYATAIIDCNPNHNHLSIHPIIYGTHPTITIHYADPNLHNKLTNYITNLNHIYPQLNHCTERHEEEALNQ